MKITLKVEENNTVESIQHEIKKANIKQISGALKIVTEIVKAAEQDEGLKEFASELAGAFEQEDIKDEEFGVVILKSLPSVVETLLSYLPEKVLEILAELSGIEYDVLIQQDPLDVMDIYDAVLEVNDMERLIERVKKSLAATKKLSTIIKLPTTSPATQAAQQ